MPAQAEKTLAIALIQPLDGLSVTPDEDVVELGTETSIDIQLSQGEYSIITRGHNFNFFFSYLFYGRKQTVKLD